MADITKADITNGFQTLISGYRNFRTNSWLPKQEFFKKLATHGQAPYATIISCCDSRVPPEIVFDSAPGELFTERNVSNIVPQYEQGNVHDTVFAALNFSVKTLRVKHIIVMGHASCGGISAYLQNDAETLSRSDFSDAWIRTLEHAEQNYLDKQDLKDLSRQTGMERAGICQSMNNLRGIPYIRDLEQQGQLSLHGLWFDIKNGLLLERQRDSNHFQPIT